MQVKAPPAPLPDGYRTAPHDLESEQAILGNLLYDNATMDAVDGILTAEMFYEPVHRRIFALLRDRIRAGDLADAILIGRAVGDDPALQGAGGREYIAHLAQSGIFSHMAPKHARHIRNLANRRAVIDLCSQTLNAAYEADEHGSFDSAPLIAELTSGVDRLSGTAIGDTSMSFGQVVEALAKKLENPVQVLPTGLPSLNRSMGGGMRPGVYLIEGKAKSSKSALLGTIAWHHMKLGTRALAITLEMGPEMVIQRLVGAESGFGYNSLEDPRYIERNVERVFDFRAKHAAAEHTFRFDDLAGADVDTIVAKIRKAAKDGTVLFFVDYWQLISGRKGGESQAEFLERVAYALYNLSKELGIIIVLASQLNRGGDSLGGDGAKRACNWAGVIHPVDLGPGPNGFNRRGLWIAVDQNRFAPAGPIGSADDPSLLIETGPVVVEANPSIRQDIEAFHPPAGPPAPIVEPVHYHHHTDGTPFDPETGEVPW